MGLSIVLLGFLVMGLLVIAGFFAFSRSDNEKKDE